MKWLAVVALGVVGVLFWGEGGGWLFALAFVVAGS